MVGFVSPRTGAALWKEGETLVSVAGERVPVVRSIPRFVPSDDYTAPFGLQWNEHPHTQLDSRTSAEIMTVFQSLNQRAITAYYGGMNSVNFQTPLVPGPGVSIFNGASAYQALESGYNPQTWINGNGGAVSPVIKSSWYGQPFLFQNARSIHERRDKSDKQSPHAQRGTS